MENQIRIGVSSCLLGEKVRYDGGHKLDPYITETLGRRFTLVPFCPEVGCGLPVPREAMRLEGEPLTPRLITKESRMDLTGRMLAWCRETVIELERQGLSGFIFKKGSPSCGLFRVPVFDQAVAGGSGRGLFAAAVAARFPHLPVVEEEQLADPEFRAAFIKRVFACRIIH